MGFRHTLAWIPALFRAGDAVKGVLLLPVCSVCAWHPSCHHRGWDCRGQEGRALFLPGVPRSVRAPPAPRSSVWEQTKVSTSHAQGSGGLSSPCSSSGTHPPCGWCWPPTVPSAASPRGAQNHPEPSSSWSCKEQQSCCCGSFIHQSPEALSARAPRNIF